MKIGQWFAVVASLSLLVGCTNAGKNAQGGNAAGFAMGKPGITQSTQINYSSKRLTIRIVRHTDVKPTGHHTPTLEYSANRVTIPTGWTVSVEAHDQHRNPMGVSIVPGEHSSNRRFYTNIGTTVTFAQPGEYLILSSVSGVHGSVLDYITVSDTATEPSVSPG